MIGKSLGHKNVTTTAVYARDMDPVRLNVNTAANAILTAGEVLTVDKTDRTLPEPQNDGSVNDEGTNAEPAPDPDV